MRWRPASDWASGPRGRQVAKAFSAPQAIYQVPQRCPRPKTKYLGRPIHSATWRPDGLNKCAFYLVLALLLAGCDQYHMISQQKMRDDGPAEPFPRGQSDQPPVPGTVARGDIAREQELTRRPPMSLALLQRGHQRFDIYCSPCHGLVGDGQGMIPQRGFPHPPTFHQDRLRQAPDSHFLDVIRDGYGIMYSYAARVPPSDRWAIVAYIRALQLSQDLRLAELPDDLKKPLETQGQR